MSPAWIPMRQGLLCLLCALGLQALDCSSGGVAACKTDEDCPAGRYCRPDGCAYDCTYDSDCPKGFHCDQHGRCGQGCAVTNHGVEACDGIDNDCDSLTDEDFPDLGKPCQNGGCPPGVYVCKEDGSGVECNGRVPAADDSTCDGIDDDCDGSTDEDALPKACPLQQGVCAGVMTRCVAGKWSDCDYGPNYDPGTEQHCDGLDNDCDGSTDEDAPPSLLPETGSQAHDGTDNNCNGLVDEVGGVNVRLPGIDNTWIDSFEMGVFEHADCTGRQYGVGADDYPPGFPAQGSASVTLYACSLPGIVPSGHLSWYRASWACLAQGKRLCSQAEWVAACQNAALYLYPYGMSFAPGACNDPIGGKGQPAPTGSFPQCTSGNSGIFDMSGNLSEWVADSDPIHPANALVGGFSYTCDYCTWGTSCFTCDPNWSSSYRSFVVGALDCTLQADNPEESFLKNDPRIALGARCCQDGP